MDTALQLLVLEIDAMQGPKQTERCMRNQWAGKLTKNTTSQDEQNIAIMLRYRYRTESTKRRKIKMT